MYSAPGGITVGDSVKSSFTISTKDAAKSQAVAESLLQDSNDAIEALFPLIQKQKKYDPLREFLRAFEERMHWSAGCSTAPGCA